MLKTPRSKPSFDSAKTGHEDANFCQASLNGAGKTPSIRSFITHKSKYTNSSKLTQSLLNRVVSKSNLEDKINDTLKEKDVEIEILNNSLEGIKKNEQSVIWKFGELFGQLETAADQLSKELLTAQ